MKVPIDYSADLVTLKADIFSVGVLLLEMVSSSLIDYSKYDGNHKALL